MNITLEDISPVQKKLTVEISAEEVSAKFNEAIRYLKKNVSIRGFRKGKAPRTVLEREYGPQIKNEVMEKLIQEHLPAAIEEAGVVMILEPSLDKAGELVDGKPFTFSVLMDIEPEFELPEYKGIKVKRPVVRVSDEEVENQYQELLKHFAEVVSIEEDRPVREGDLVVIDYTVSIDGEPDDELSADDYYLEVGSGTLGEEFDKHLAGIEKQKPVSFEISYPEDAVNAKFAGKSVAYTVTLKEIKQRVLPEENEEFFTRLGRDFKTAEDVKARLREQIMEDKEETADSLVRQQITAALVEGLDFEIPERLIEKKLDQMIDNLAGHMQERGIDLERAGIDEGRLRERMRDDAVEQVRVELVLDKISEDAKIDIPTGELKQYTDYVESSYEKMNVSRDQLASAVFENVLPKLRASKTLEFLVEHADITDVDPDDMPSENNVKAE
jgi:trigger factor